MTLPNDLDHGGRQKTLYEGSTQYKNWRYSESGLSDVRRSQNIEAVRKIRDAFEKDLAGSSSGIDFLSAEEEHVLVKLYITKVAQLCAHFRFPEEVEATAVSYLKRFYLRNTVMDYHPKNVMLTAIFLAAKTSNHPIGIDHYVNNIPKTKASDVLDLEFLVAQSLRFEFTVWHVHRALWGIWLDAQGLDEFDSSTADGIYDAAQTQVRASRLTDLELIYTPSQIALACMCSASESLGEKWARMKSPNGADEILEFARRIQAVIEQDSQPPDLDIVRGIDKRLKICTNPEKVVGSKAYLAKRAEIEAEAATKRAEKAEEIRMALDRDPFGPEPLQNVAFSGLPTENQAEDLSPEPQ